MEWTNLLPAYIDWDFPDCFIANKNENEVRLIAIWDKHSSENMVLFCWSGTSYEKLVPSIFFTSKKIYPITLNFCYDEEVNKINIWGGYLMRLLVFLGFFHDQLKDRPFSLMQFIEIYFDKMNSVLFWKYLIEHKLQLSEEFCFKQINSNYLQDCSCLAYVEQKKLSFIKSGNLNL